MSQPGRKLWGGRFCEDTDPALEQLNRSITVDQRMFAEDIEGSIAYAGALCDSGVLTSSEKIATIQGLRKVLQEWQSGSFVIQPSDEDIHTANERRLKELVGEVASKLHTGRSRNDQVTTDAKLWLRKAGNDLAGMLSCLITAMASRAEVEVDVLMPGYTHLQRAQPVRWSHWLLSHAWSLRSDLERLAEVMKRAWAELPLGSGALAGTPLALDRQLLATALGFSRPSANSMHAVADRDYVAEFLFWASLTSTHLSKLAEDLLLFCTAEFSFARVAESLSTGSSLMPHKRNPDSLELVRAKSAVISGQCSTFLSLLKGLPSTYNKDLQQDKVAMFQVYDDLKLIIQVTEAVVCSLELNEAACRKGLSPDMLATDLAYYLVRKGVAFRDAHHLVGRVVRLAEERKQPLSSIGLADLKAISGHFSENVQLVWSYDASVEQYRAVGGTSRANVLLQASELRQAVEDLQKLFT